MSPTGDVTAIFKWPSEACEGLPVCGAKEVPSFLSYFKGAVSRNSAKLGNYKTPVKLRET